MFASVASGVPGATISITSPAANVTEVGDCKLHVVPEAANRNVTFVTVFTFTRKSVWAVAAVPAEQIVPTHDAPELKARGVTNRMVALAVGTPSKLTATSYGNANVVTSCAGVREAHALDDD